MVHFYGRGYPKSARYEHKDERLSGGASLILRYLTPSSADLTVPVMTKYLNGPASPNLVKVDVASTLLSFRPSDPQAIKAMGIFLGKEAEPKVRIATLQAIGANHISNPEIDDFAIRSLDDTNKYVRVAAIHTTHSLGSEAWSRAQPTITKLATNPSEDRDIRIAADKELKNSVASAHQRFRAYQARPRNEIICLVSRPSFQEG